MMTKRVTKRVTKTPKTVLKMQRDQWIALSDQMNPREERAFLKLFSVDCSLTPTPHGVWSWNDATRKWTWIAMLDDRQPSVNL